MPDVGVLNLQIHDDSKQAAKGLDYLAGALYRVKKATEGLRLNSVASSIKRIADAVNQNLTGNTITKIRALATELEKLKGLGTVNINFKAANQIKKTVESIVEGKKALDEIAQTGGSAAKSAMEGFDELKQEVHETTMESIRLHEELKNIKKDSAQDKKSILNSANDTIRNIDYSKVNIKEYLTDPLTSLQDRYKMVSGTVDNLRNKIDASIPVLKNYRDTVFGLESKKDIAMFGKKTGDQLLASIKEIGEAGKETAEEMAETTKEAVQEITQGINDSIIQLNRAAHNKYKPLPDRTFEDMYYGFRYRRDEDGNNSKYKQKDLIYEAMHGRGTEREQLYAIQEAARQLGTTVEDVRLKIAQVNGVADKAKEHLRELFNAHYYATSDMKQTVDETLGIGEGSKSARESMLAFLDGMQGAGPVVERIRELNPELAEMSDRSAAVEEHIKILKERFSELFKTSKGGSFSKLLSQFARIAKYRFLRAVLKNITEGFREGVENVYYYSKAIGGSFAPAMDNAASAIEQMKNSVGAALAPAIEAMIPLMQTLVGWFIEGVNYLNQFFALLNGQTTWTRALPRTAKAFKDQEKAARSAGAAIKDLLASWDELNIIQSETGGGSGISGATAAEDYLKMFEEVGTFENKIKDIVDFIKNNFETIKTVAIGIGAAMLAWKVAEGIHDVLKLVGTLQGGVIMSVVGFTLSAAAGASMGQDGFTPENVLAGVGGLAASALGGYWVGKNLLTSFGFSGATGGMVGAVAGLAIGAAFLITNFNASVVEGAYGTLKEDADTIRKNVMSYFNPKVNAEVNVAKAYVQNTEDAENKVGEALTVLEKDYPVAVTLKTKEALDSLQMSVSNLIREAEALILLRKQNIKIPIVASGQYGDNAESVLKFSTDQLDKTYAYMEDLGKKIGTEISNGITDGAKLDKLKQQLTDITNAVTFGLKKGEFAATMSIAGSKLRSNQYSKDALTQYINTYNTERDSLTAEAEAMARAEQGDLESIYASTLEMFKNNEATWEEVQTAFDNYKKFDAAKEAERILKEWVGEGDTLFGADIAQALSIVMERTSKQGLFFGRNSALSFAKNSQVDMNGVLAAVTNAEGYIAILRDKLLSSIAEETGQDKEAIKNLFDLSGINPLDLFDADYGNQIREAITRTLENSQYTEEEKNKIKEAFGFPDMKGNKVSEETNEAAAAYEDMASRIRGAFKSIDGLEFNLDLNGTSGKVNVTLPVVATMATGGFPRSGDLIMANENGNIEMMGKMGSQPVVANNQQIVEGISHGVSNANEDVVSELRGLGSMMRQLLANGLVAKAVPGSDWGAHNARSEEAYERVRG